MQLITTVTPKGQVSIPKQIRDQFGIRPFSKMIFSVVGADIVMKTTPTVNQMAGFIKSSKHFTQEDYDRAIEEGIKNDYS